MNTLQFDAVAEASPGPKWRARWERSWPAYEAWFRAAGGEDGPDRAACDAALARYMPELVPLHAELTRIAGGSDRAARFLSGWCPPSYLGGCSLAALAGSDTVRLVRNYDLSPDLNEGLLLRTEWTGRPVMGMIEFLWGISDGINEDGLAVALAYGGRSETAEGFGICHILRHVLETCSDVAGAIGTLRRIPSHMAYNLVLADRAGHVAAVEMRPGGGLRERPRALATNHQSGAEPTERAAFTRTVERLSHLEALTSNVTEPETLAPRFLDAPLFQTDYARGFGTLFTAEYDPRAGAVVLHWPEERMAQSLSDFREGGRLIRYDGGTAAQADWIEAILPWIGAEGAAWAEAARSGEADWVAFGQLFARPRPEAAEEEAA